MKTLKALPWWWFAFAFLIIILCGAFIFIFKVPNIQDMILLALVAVTMMYVMITQRMLGEMRQQRINASQPVIWPSVELIWPSYGWKVGLDVRLLNLGNGPALEVDVFLVSGSERKERRRVDLLVPRETKILHFLAGPTVMSLNSLVDEFKKAAGEFKLGDEFKKAAGEYTLLVEWRDIHTSGPYFQARLPFIVQPVSHSLGLAKQAVKIEPIRKRYLD